MYNAFKYTTYGFINVYGELKNANGIDYLQIKVEDSGCGMNQDLIKRLFSLFSNMKFKGNVNQHGIGLGLAICKNIVDSMNGFISCKSLLNIGSTFKVIIPIQMDESIS